MEKFLADTWLYYWAYILIAGVLNALVIWWLGGWWYRKRLQWSSCTDPSRKLSRLVLIYSSFVSAGPAVVLAIITSMVFPSFIAAYNSESLLPLFILVFPFWSVIVSYKGATSLFEVSLSRARIWFLALPLVLYMLLVGIFGAIGAYMSGA